MELMVGMGVALLVFGAVLGGWVYSLRWSRAWQDRLALRSALHVAMTRLCEDAFRLERLDAVSDSSLAGRSGDGRTVEIERAGRTLLRNGRPMLGPGIEVLRFEVRLRRGEERGWGRAVDESPPAGISFTMTLTDGRRRLSAESTVAFRRPVGWQGRESESDP